MLYQDQFNSIWRSAIHQAKCGLSRENIHFSWSHPEHPGWFRINHSACWCGAWPLKALFQDASYSQGPLKEWFYAFIQWQTNTSPEQRCVLLMPFEESGFTQVFYFGIISVTYLPLLLFGFSANIEYFCRVALKKHLLVFQETKRKKIILNLHLCILLAF